jgi:hypothetical protein
MQSDLLQRLGHELDDMSRLHLAWSRVLPGPLADHTRPRHYEQGKLTVSVSSAAWGSRLRQQQTRLIDRLRHEPGLSDLHELAVQIVPKGEHDTAADLRTLADSTRRAPARLSPQTAQLLREVAERVTDPDLRAALERLAKTAEQGRR